MLSLVCKGRDLTADNITSGCTASPQPRELGGPWHSEAGCQAAGSASTEALETDLVRHWKPLFKKSVASPVSPPVLCLTLRFRQVVQCKHLSALLCHSTAHTVQLQQLLHSYEPSAALRGKALYEILSQSDEEQARKSSSCAGASAAEDTPQGEENTFASGFSLDPNRLVQDLTRELQAVRHESEQLKAPLMTAARLSTQDGEQLIAELKRANKELEHMQMLNALQAAKHEEAWQRASVKRETLRRGWLKKLDALSLRLVHRKRVHRIFQNWSERCRARKAGHEMVYERRVNCCMLHKPCIQCEHLSLADETVTSSQLSTAEWQTVTPHEKSDALELETKKSALTLRQDIWRDCHASFDSSFSGCCAHRHAGLSSDELEYVWQTVKQLATLIYEQASTTFQGSTDGLDVPRHGGKRRDEAGVLGAIFDADGTVIEVVPHSPAYICGSICIGDRLLSVSRQHRENNTLRMRERLSILGSRARKQNRP